MEEKRIRQEEEEEVERKRDAATRLARERGLSISHEPGIEVKDETSIMEDETYEIPGGKAEIAEPTNPEFNIELNTTDDPSIPSEAQDSDTQASKLPNKVFVPARLPNF